GADGRLRFVANQSGYGSFSFWTQNAERVIIANDGSLTAINLNASLNVQASTFSTPSSGAVTIPAAAAVPTANQLIRTQANGYAYTHYIWYNTPIEGPAVSEVMTTTGDGDRFMRRCSLAQFNASISPAWANISG